MNDDHFMKKALELAEGALSQGEFPVGCVMVHREEILVTGTRRGTISCRPRRSNCFLHHGTLPDVLCRPDTGRYW